MTKNELAALVLGYWDACEEGTQTLDGCFDLVQSEVEHKLTKEECEMIELIYSEC